MNVLLILVHKTVGVSTLLDLTVVFALKGISMADVTTTYVLMHALVRRPITITSTIAICTATFFLILLSKMSMSVRLERMIVIKTRYVQILREALHVNVILGTLEMEDHNLV